MGQTPQTEAFRAVLFLSLAMGTDLLHSQLNLPWFMSYHKGFILFCLLFNSLCTSVCRCLSPVKMCPVRLFFLSNACGQKVSHTGCNLSISFYCCSILLIIFFFRYSFVLLWSKTLSAKSQIMPASSGENLTFIIHY